MMAYFARGFSTGAFWASAFVIRPGQVSRHKTAIEQRKAELLLVIVLISLLGSFFLTEASEPRGHETAFGSADDPIPGEVGAVVLAPSKPLVNVQKF